MGICSIVYCNEDEKLAPYGTVGWLFATYGPCQFQSRNTKTSQISKIWPNKI